jgi:hypothetical protein
MLKTNDPIEFMLHYSTYQSYETHAVRLQAHQAYKTCRIILDPADDTVIAVCLWNISADGKTAHVLDYIVREDWRNRNLAIQILRDGMKIWKVEELVWDKGYDDGLQDKPLKRWSVDRFLRRKI